MLISDRLSVSANIGKAISVNRNIGKIPYRCITTCVFALLDQQTDHIIKILAKHIVPFFDVPEAILSDRGTNLLSHLMLDVCKVLGIQKLNTTAYHPQCGGLVQRYNRTLKAMLAARYGLQWDQYLASVQWAYHNTPHEATGKNPSYLLFGIDC